MLQLNKQIFVLQLEKGVEVPIPIRLRDTKLPMAYQYYNCLFDIITQNVNQDSKYYLLKVN